MRKKDQTKRNRKKMMRLLTTKPTNLTLKEHLQLEEWFSNDDDVYELYQALQGLRRIYVPSELQTLKQALQHWRGRYLFSEVHEVRRISKTILQWKEPLIHSIYFKVSNGKVEGINNKIKMIKRRAYGYQNIHRFGLRVQLETAQ